MDAKPKRPIVGLAQVPKGVRFRCGECEYYANGRCHHPEKQLHLRPVERDWCCDFYEHPGMKIHVK